MDLFLEIIALFFFVYKQIKKNIIKYYILWEIFMIKA